MKQLFLAVFLVKITFGVSSDAFAEAYPEDSIFQLGQTWQDAGGKEFPLSKLHGEIAIAAFVYTSCQFACPLIIEEMNRVMKQVKPAMQKNVKRVLISIDPERDTPKVLQAFAKKRKLDPSNWILLTAPGDKQVRELAVVMGATYKKMGDDFAHSNLIAVLNKNGKIVFTKQNIGSQIEEAAKAIDGLEGKKK